MSASTPNPRFATPGLLALEAPTPSKYTNLELMLHEYHHRARQISTLMSTIGNTSSLSQLEAQVVHARCLYLEEKFMKWLQRSVLSGNPSDAQILLNKHFHFIEDLQIFERELRYLAVDMLIFPIPNTKHFDISHEQRNKEKALTNARLLWLLQMRHEGRENYTFPTVPGQLRFDDVELVVHRGLQIQLLPQRYRAMCTRTRTMPPSLEWQFVSQLVGHLTMVEVGLFDGLREGLANAGARPPAFSMEDFTTPATTEALEKGYDECPICGFALLDTPGYEVEPTVKTSCGHFFGKECLRAWAQSWAEERKEGLPTCPTCRLLIWSPVDELPEVMKPIVRELVTFLRSDPDLDREVDAYLLNFSEEGMDGCADISVGVMMEKLRSRSSLSGSTMNVMRRMIENLRYAT